MDIEDQLKVVGTPFKEDDGLFYIPRDDKVYQRRSEQGIAELPRGMRASVRKYCSFSADAADVASTDSSSESEDDVPDFVSNNGDSDFEDSEYDSDSSKDGEGDTVAIDLQIFFVGNKYMEDDSESTAASDTSSNVTATDTDKL